MFIYNTIRYDGTAGHFIFKCRCGSDDCVHVSYNGPAYDEGFYEGNYMCSKCGTSLDVEPHELCYYSPEFVFIPDPVQLSLF